MDDYIPFKKDEIAHINEPQRDEPVRCSKRLEGPPVSKGSPIVQWSRQCKNMTKNRSGRCNKHPKGRLP